MRGRSYSLGVMAAVVAAGMVGVGFEREPPMELIEPQPTPERRPTARAQHSTERVRRAAEKRARKAEKLRALQAKGAIL